MNIWERQWTKLWTKSQAVLQTLFQMECVKTSPTWRPYHPSISTPCKLIYRNIPTNIHTFNGRAARTEIFILNALSELFMAWQVCCVLSNAEYLLFPTIPTNTEPKKLIREETVHAQHSKTVSGLNWILFCDRYQNPIDFTHAWPLQVSQTLSGTQLVQHVWCYACRINTQHYDARISLPLLTAHAHSLTVSTTQTFASRTSSDSVPFFSKFSVRLDGIRTCNMTNDIQCVSFISALSTAAVTRCPGGYDFLYNKAPVFSVAIPRKTVNISTRSCVSDITWLMHGHDL